MKSPQPSVRVYSVSYRQTADSKILMAWINIEAFRDELYLTPPAVVEKDHLPWTNGHQSREQDDNPYPEVLQKHSDSDCDSVETGVREPTIGALLDGGRGKKQHPKTRQLLYKP